MEFMLKRTLAESVVAAVNSLPTETPSWEVFTRREDIQLALFMVFSILFESPRTVGFDRNVDNGTSTPKVPRILDIIRAAERECPPSWKKSAPTVISSRGFPSIWANKSRTESSILDRNPCLAPLRPTSDDETDFGELGDLSRTTSSGGGSAFRFTLWFDVRGKSFIRTNLLGIIKVGNLALKCARNVLANRTSDLSLGIT
mmetsp:Transcript_32178/g.51180  ORF Transcript_32178/g.51180 Transcript_32178/m.51180 type:complete len:201 (+) Transcript_32178:5588-6190(+)